MQQDVPLLSWLDPRVEIAPSLIDRHGLFATARIKCGEVVIRWGGRVITDAEVEGLQRAFETTGTEYSCASIGEGLSLLQASDDPLRYGNHSCDPNLWMVGATTQEARRDIAAGEELTTDYGTISATATWRMDCRCGSRFCRKTVTGDDWRLPELHDRYGEHFSPFLLARFHGTGRA